MGQDFLERQYHHSATTRRRNETLVPTPIIRPTLNRIPLKSEHHYLLQQYVFSICIVECLFTIRNRSDDANLPSGGFLWHYFTGFPFCLYED